MSAKYTHYPSPISISSSESQAFPAAAAILPVIITDWLIDPCTLSLFGHCSDTFVLALIPFTVAIKSHAQFCIQDSNQCNKLECSTSWGTKRRAVSRSSSSKKKPPPNSSDLSSLQTKIFFPAQQSEIFNSFWNQRTFLHFFFFWLLELGSVERGRRFCCSN